MTKANSPFLRFFVIALWFSSCTIDQADDFLEKNFQDPPASARPRTWFHAMSGNMTREGLTKDLEAIERVGIGGILLFNVSQGIPNGPIKYNSPEHHEMLKHAAMECERLGLSFGVHNCDGWSSSGGPWITPEQSMKMVVWSEAISKGGNIEMKLPQPTMREGFYEDIAVLAYPSLPSELSDFENKPKITSSDPGLDKEIITDNRLDATTQITKSSDSDTWIQFEYQTEKEIQSVLMVFNDRHGEAMLQVSDDGMNFRTVHKLYKVRTGKGEWAINDHFDGLKSKFFRLALNQSMTFKEARLSSIYSVHNVLGRTAIARTESKDLLPIGTPCADMIVDKNAIINLTDKMDDDGTLQADLKDGNWTILRFGYTSTGAFNHPASDEGRGLECDKFSKEAFKIHYDAFVKKVIDNTREIAPNALQYVEIDSYEMGGQNWTEDLDHLFKKENGYDIITFLPLFAGRFVESASSSEAVLGDFRKLTTSLMAENYFGYFAELCRKDGVKSYIEPYGFGPLNDLDVGAHADINMGEFWMNREMNMVQSAVFASHIYGKNVISAESFTSTPEINWKGHPAMAKISGDRAWAHGINEFMFHRFAHQANTHVEPGMTMNRWGFHFDRTQTWWENAGKDWFKYMSRGQYLLRQGIPVADILVFVGDGAPNSVYSREDLGLPVGYNYDCVNTDVLVNRARAQEGKIILPEGITYHALVLKNSKTITLESIRKIGDLSSAKVPIIGAPPERLLGYQRSEEDRAEFEELRDEIWSRSTTYSNSDLGEVLQKIGSIPDLAIQGRDDIRYMHRRLHGCDIYFIYNPDSIARQLDCTFRIDQKIPELWNPMTGSITKSGQFESIGNVTKAWIDLQAEESVFIVFREKAKGVSSVSDPENLANEKYYLNEENKLYALEQTNDPALKIEGNWDVEFLGIQNGQKKYHFDQLTDWKDQDDENIKYYSGSAIYRNTFSLSTGDFTEKTKYILDLGEVKIVAEVKLNGQDLGVLWMPPFQVDISDALQEGDNILEITITNQWSNKLIGDERFPPSYTGYQLEGNFPKGSMMEWYSSNEPMPSGLRSTFCTASFYKAGDPLMPSGLLGPVLIYSQRLKMIEP